MLCAKTDAIRGCLVSSSRRCAKLLLAAFLLSSATAALAIQEIEPNNTCALAQNVGPLTPNVTVTVIGSRPCDPPAFAASREFEAVVRSLLIFADS